METVEGEVEPEIKLKDGCGILFRQGALRYLAAWPDAALLKQILTGMADEASMEVQHLPEGVRLRRAGKMRFAFNYASETVQLVNAPGRNFVLGDAVLPPAGVAVWRED
jgi:beta-galactosidase